MLQSSHLLVKSSSSPSNPWHRTVFYNIYVPNAEEKARIMDIVREQLAEMKSSRVWNTVRLLYNVIGYNATADIQQECGSQCYALTYRPQADESLTLQAIYDYCKEHDNENTDTPITYIHNKGSLNPSPANDDIRRLLTKATFSEACQTVGMGENTCNLCGARFSPLPHHHFPGNMWTAQCSYIRMLHRPDAFAAKMENLMDDIMHVPNIPKPTIPQYESEWFVGRRRCALEHWVATHPTIRPCDVYPDGYLWAYENLPNSTNHWVPDMQSAPRFSLSTFEQPLATYFDPPLPSHGTWHCGKGRLLEYQYLYGERPPEDSFFWSLYAEALTACTEPLEFSKHASLYDADLSTILNNK